MIEQQFTTAKYIKDYEPVISESSFRHLYFYKGRELDKEGVTVRMGRRLLISIPKLREYVASGKASVVSGKGA